MRTDSTARSPDLQNAESRNAMWRLLQQNASTDGNLSILLERFEPGGAFPDHAHEDFEQYFYITKGQFEMTIGSETDIYREGDLVFTPCGVSHVGRNLMDHASELLALNYWPAAAE
jgi:quercetin dioxygenase-like cupin family protein